MEEQLRINWPAVVEAAKQKRKTLKLTQQRLAELAGVSAPTVSHFESGQKDIQLSTITRILSVLGMLDERMLIFPNPKPRYDSGRMSVLFDGRDGEKTVQCAISEEALKDHFSDDDDARRTFLNNQESIEAEARRKYLAGYIKPDGSVLIVSMDLYR
jgi:transcriptional regulator with XRE-family HTH domain